MSNGNTIVFNGNLYIQIGVKDALCEGCALNRTELCDPINDYLCDNGGKPCWEDFDSDNKYSQFRIVEHK